MMITSDVAEDRLLLQVERALAAGVDYVQLRRRDIAARELQALAKRLVGLSARAREALLVNGRLDVALSSHAKGVHLPARGLPIAAVLTSGAPVASSFPAPLIGGEEVESACERGRELRRLRARLSHARRSPVIRGLGSRRWRLPSRRSPFRCMPSVGSRRSGSLRSKTPAPTGSPGSPSSRTRRAFARSSTGSSDHDAFGIGRCGRSSQHAGGRGPAARPSRNGRGSPSAAPPQTGASELGHRSRRAPRALGRAPSRFARPSCCTRRLRRTLSLRLLSLLLWRDQLRVATDYETPDASSRRRGEPAPRETLRARAGREDFPRADRASRTSPDPRLRRKPPRGRGGPCRTRGSRGRRRGDRAAREDPGRGPAGRGGERALDLAAIDAGRASSRTRALRSIRRSRCSRRCPRWEIRKLLAGKTASARQFASARKGF